MDQTRFPYLLNVRGVVTKVARNVRITTQFVKNVLREFSFKYQTKMRRPRGLNATTHTMTIITVNGLTAKEVTVAINVCLKYPTRE